MDKEILRSVFYAGFGAAKAQKALNRVDAFSLWLLKQGSESQLESIPWNVAAKEYAQGKAKIFYKTNDDTMLLRGLGDGRFGFVCLEREGRNATFISPNPTESVRRSLDETLNNGVRRQLYWTNATLSEILNFKP